MSSSNEPAETVKIVVGEEEGGARLDAFLAGKLPQYSRVQIRRAISTGEVKVDNKLAKPSYKLKVGQEAEMVLPEIRDTGPQPENIPIDILFEDDHVIAINKPPAMVVHPAKGHWSGTLASAVAYHFQSLSDVGGQTRPGIVHRLDRDTSGVILIAKNNEAHLGLASQFEARTIQKEYFAVVSPPPDRNRDMIEKAIGIHPYQREKMAVREGHSSSRNASTFYEVLTRSGRFATVKIQPKTGRTHQIRVHLVHKGHPVVCDKLYSGHSELKEKDVLGNESENVILSRQALHARRIKFQHPINNTEVEIEAPIPADIQCLLDLLEK